MRAVDWSSAATADLLNIPNIASAEQVARAVRRYAEDGIGFVLHVPTADAPDEFDPPHANLRATLSSTRSTWRSPSESRRA